MQKSVFLVGDGAQLCYNTCLDMGISAVLAPGNLVVQSAWGVAMAAFGQKPAPAEELLPVYLRLSQAERERQARLAAEAEKRLKVKYGCNKGDDEMSKVHVFDHPLIQHKLSILRDKHTSVKEFRELISEIAMLMCFEATRDLPLEEIDVETPVATAHCRHIAGKKLAIVPILRAGLGMVDGMVTMMPNVKVGHIGLFRDPQTLEPVKYYFKMPPDIAERDVIIVDPMLATGGSASAAVKFMKEVGCKHIKLMCIIGAPEGVQVMQTEHPDVDIYVAALDDHLNEHGYIVPGLGDAGDRIFGTK